MGLEELSQSAFEVAVFEGDVSEIRLLFGQLLFEAMVVVLSAVQLVFVVILQVYLILAHQDFHL